MLYCVKFKVCSLGFSIATIILWICLQKSIIYCSSNIVLTLKRLSSLCRCDYPRWLSIDVNVNSKKRDYTPLSVKDVKRNGQNIRFTFLFVLTAIHFTYIISEFQTKVWISCSCRLKILTLLRCKIIGGSLKSLYITNINTYIFKTFIWFAYNSTIIFPFSNVYVPVNKKGKILFVFQFFFSLKSENAFFL